MNSEEHGVVDPVQVPVLHLCSFRHSHGDRIVPRREVWHLELETRAHDVAGRGRPVLMHERKESVVTKQVLPQAVAHQEAREGALDPGLGLGLDH